MNRLTISALMIAMLLCGAAYACVGKTIHLGIIAPNERLLAEMTSLMITERTGSSVTIDVYRDSKDLYAAVKQGKVNIILENTERAADLIAKTRGGNTINGYDAIKSEYRRTFNMSWLDPISGTPQYAAVLTMDTLSNYPALPKLLNKLAGALQNDAYARMARTADQGDRARKAAKDFLKSRKLI